MSEDNISKQVSVVKCFHQVYFEIKLTFWFYREQIKQAPIIPD